MSRTKDWLMRSPDYEPNDQYPPDEDQYTEPVFEERPFGVFITLSLEEYAMLKRLMPYKFDSSKANANRCYDSLRAKIFEAGA